jgi:biotin-(acetyl-CoA carboxylase) ligase
MKNWKVNDRVTLRDCSETEQFHGRIDHIQDDGIIIVELDNGCCWPVEADEISAETLK